MKFVFLMLMLSLQSALFAQQLNVKEVFDMVYHAATKEYFGFQPKEILVEDLKSNYLKIKSKKGNITFIIWHNIKENKIAILDILEKCSSICVQEQNVLELKDQKFLESKKSLLPLTDIEVATNTFLPHIIQQFDYYEYWIDFHKETRGLIVGYRVRKDLDFVLIPLLELIFNGERFVVSKFIESPPHLKLPDHKITRFPSIK